MLASTLTYSCVTGMRFLNGERKATYTNSLLVSTLRSGSPHLPYPQAVFTTSANLTSLDEKWMEDENMHEDFGLQIFVSQSFSYVDGRECE